MDETILYRGFAQFKQDKFMATWSKKWFVLTQQTLSWHTSEVRNCSSFFLISISLNGIIAIQIS